MILRLGATPKSAASSVVNNCHLTSKGQIFLSYTSGDQNQSIKDSSEYKTSIYLVAKHYYYLLLLS